MCIHIYIYIYTYIYIYIYTHGPGEEPVDGAAGDHAREVPGGSEEVLVNYIVTFTNLLLTSPN